MAGANADGVNLFGPLCECFDASRFETAADSGSSGLDLGSNFAQGTFGRLAQALAMQAKALGHLFLAAGEFAKQLRNTGRDRRNARFRVGTDAVENLLARVFESVSRLPQFLIDQGFYAGKGVLRF